MPLTLKNLNLLRFHIYYENKFFLTNSCCNFCFKSNSLKFSVIEFIQTFYLYISNKVLNLLLLIYWVY